MKPARLFYCPIIGASLLLSACSHTSTTGNVVPPTLKSIRPTSLLASIKISTERPRMPEPVHVGRDHLGHLRSVKDVTGDPVSVVSVAPPISADSLTNLPMPIVPSPTLPSPYPYPTPDPVPTDPPYGTCKPRCPALRTTRSYTHVDDAGGQSGYTINGGSGAGVGDIYVAHQALTNVALNPVPSGDPYPGQSIFAPTTHGPNGNCMEVVTDYYNGYGLPAGVSSAQVLLFNFCDRGGRYEGAVPMDQTFFNKYVRTFSNGNGQPEYVAEIEQGSDTAWHLLLYNVSANTWDDYSDSAPGAIANYNGGQGWSMFETHVSTGPCSFMPSTGISGLRLHFSNVPHQDWQYATGSRTFGWGDCFQPDGTSSYWYSINFSSSDWGWQSGTFGTAPA